MKYLYILIMIALLTGCNIGLKTHNNVVIVGLGKAEPIKGAVRIITNKKITIKAGGLVAEKDIAGYYAIKESDLNFFLDVTRAMNSLGGQNKIDVKKLIKQEAEKRKKLLDIAKGVK